MSTYFDQQLFSSNSSKIISSGRPPYLIAEIGLNHNNDMVLTKEMIEAAAESGADAVKFQSYFVDSFIVKKEPKMEGLYDIFKTYELGEDEHYELKEFSESRGLDYFSTPLTVEWVKILVELKVPYIKVASGDLNNYLLLKEIVKYNTPVIISTGNSSLDNINDCAAFFRLHKKKNIMFLHCISVYPASNDELMLGTIPVIQKELDVLVGYSDHSIGTDAAFAAVSMGAVAIEKHFTLDKNLPGPDHSISAEPEDLKSIRKKIDLAYEMCRSSREEPLPEESESDYFGKRSIYNVKGKDVAMRPRKKGLPQDDEYFTLKSRD